MDRISNQMDRINDGRERIVEKATALCNVLEPMIEDLSKQFDEYIENKQR